MFPFWVKVNELAALTGNVNFTKYFCVTYSYDQNQNIRPVMLRNPIVLLCISYGLWV